MSMEKGTFIITIDTEGDNMWVPRFSRNSIEHRITTRNGECLFRFQQLCEKFGYKPTYLVTHEMCHSEPFVEMAKEGVKKGALEIGMHMHAWNCPPYYELEKGRKSGGRNPYVGEYPLQIIEQKVDYLTKELEDVFQIKIKSHRSGRWYIDSEYLKILKKYGYEVDCSVSPGVEWKNHPGLTDGSKCTNYATFPTYAYEMDLKHLRKKGESGFYEVPVTIVKSRENNKKRLMWLRPDGRNLQSMKDIIDKKQSENVEYVEFMLHSSEMMPGGSPLFRSEFSIEKLYDDMYQIFEYAAQFFEGKTLLEYVAAMKTKN